MFQRKIISELRLWADSKYRKPLVLRGARQVGKSTMVKEFGKEFDVFISLNLEKPDHLAIFESADIDISVKMIFLFAKKSSFFIFFPTKNKRPYFRSLTGCFLPYSPFHR